METEEDDHRLHPRTRTIADLLNQLDQIHSTSATRTTGGGGGRHRRHRSATGGVRDLPPRWPGRGGGARGLEGDAVRAPVPRRVPGEVAARARHLPHVPPPDADHYRAAAACSRAGGLSGW
ncbi:hypothetical protein EE612_017728 [Oryza sativa]|nr:hypothetical protein EE612_017728 [Oryza sativa]